MLEIDMLGCGVGLCGGDQDESMGGSSTSRMGTTTSSSERSEPVLVSLPRAEDGGTLSPAEWGGGVGTLSWSRDMGPSWDKRGAGGIGGSSATRRLPRVGGSGTMHAVLTQPRVVADRGRFARAGPAFTFR